ncbi:MAG: pilus assembly protein TadG-related protein [Pseudomonadota bacterium]
MRVLRNFLADRDGNIAIMFAFTFVLLVLFAGGAIDFTRYNAVRADLVESLDASGLAIAQLDAMNGPEIRNLSDAAREEYLKDYGRDFFHENFSHENVIDGLSVDFDITKATITPTAQGQIRTLFLHLAYDLLGTPGDGAEFLSLATETEITRRGSGKIELALVLDVTGSMKNAPNGGGDKKIVSLRNAVDNLLGVMYGADTYSDDIKIGVVPFNAHVNPAGASSWNDAWTDENAEAPYHGARFFHVDENGDIDMTRKVNHLDLFDSVTGASWMGCVEARPYPLDELDTVPGLGVQESYVTTANTPLSAAEEPDSRMRDAYARAPQLSLNPTVVASVAASRWVPMFRADEPDCPSSGSTQYCEGAYTNKTESYTVGGTPYSVTFHGRWFHDPNDDGKNRSHYGNQNFIDDRKFIYYGQGQQTPRYAKIAQYFQSTLQTPSFDQDFRTFLNAMGATSDTKDEYVLRNAYPGWWDPATGTYKYRYNLSPSIDETISDTDQTTRGPNEDCPAAILPLTQDRTKVENKLAELFPNGNTNSANGAVWGWRVLSSKAPFTEGVSETNTDWQKAVVIMTDGQNTIGNASTHWLSSPSVYGFAIEERMGKNVSKGDRGNPNTYNNDDMRDQLDEKLLRICRRMKEEGILVYTIIFDLNDSETEKVFKSCATSPTEPYYFVAPSGEDLEQAFGDIAQDLVNLHVSR